METELEKNYRNLISRRSFVGTSVGIGMAALADRAAAQDNSSRRIDFHHHFGSPEWISAITAKEGHTPKGITPWLASGSWKNFSPQRTVEALDQGGTATAMLSCTTPGIWYGDKQETRRFAHEMNEYATSKMVSAYKGRFGLFAVLPLPDIDASMKELEYALDTLKADGIGLLTSYENKWLGDPYYKPILDELNRRKAVLYTHPTDAPCCQALQPNIGPGTVEYNTDTSRTIISLITSGAATRYPDIRFIFSHAGGTLTSLIERFGVGRPEDIAEKLAGRAEPNSTLYHLRRFYYDTAQSVNPVQMQGLKMIAGASQIVFGTDYPFGNIANHGKGLQKCGFTAMELRGIERENGLRLVPRLNG